MELKGTNTGEKPKQLTGKKGIPPGRRIQKYNQKEETEGGRIHWPCKTR